MKTEGPEVTVPNATESAAGLGAALEAALAGGGGVGASAGTGPALGLGAAGTAGCPGTGREGGEAGSVLTSGTPVAAAAASAEGAARLELGAAASGLLPMGGAGAGSFFTGSGVCRGAWGSGADCSGPRSEAADAEASLVPSFSDKDGDVASSALLAEDTGGVGADAELRRPPNHKVENDVGRGVAVVAGGGADGGAVPLVG